MKRKIRRFNLYVISAIFSVLFLISGCGTAKKKEKDEVPKPLYGPPNVSINQPQSGK